MESLTNDERNTLINELSNNLQIEPEIAWAFFKVETGGLPAFCSNGKILIRFEPHVFANPIRMNKYGVDSSSVSWTAETDDEIKQKWFNLGFKHGYNCKTNENEWFALNFAINICEELAYASTSFGLPQIMGFNHSLIGYTTAKEMFESFSKSEEAQIRGFFTFVEKYVNGKLLLALQEKRFIDAARFYNGKGREQVYGVKLEKYYSELKEK